MFNPNRKPRSPLHGGQNEPPRRKPMSQAVKRRLWTTLGLTVLCFLILVISNAVSIALQMDIIWKVTLTVYIVAFAAILLTYLIYNRAFVNKNVTVEDLPDDWSPERKQAFVEDVRIRAEKTRWMVMLIIPLASVILVEFIYLFWWDSFTGIFNKG